MTDNSYISELSPFTFSYPSTSYAFDYDDLDSSNAHLGPSDALPFTESYPVYEEDLSWYRGYQLETYSVQGVSLQAPSVLTYVPDPGRPGACQTLLLYRNGSIDVRDGELSEQELDYFFRSQGQHGSSEFSVDLPRENFTLLIKELSSRAAAARHRQRYRKRPTRPNVLVQASPHLFKYGKTVLLGDVRRRSSQRTSKSSVLGFGQSVASFGKAIKRRYPSSKLERLLKEAQALVFDASQDTPPAESTSNGVTLDQKTAFQNLQSTLPLKLRPTPVRYVDAMDAASDEHPMPGRWFSSPIIGVKRSRWEVEEDERDRLAEEERLTKKFCGRRCGSVPPGL